MGECGVAGGWEGDGGVSEEGGGRRGATLYTRTAKEEEGNIETETNFASLIMSVLKLGVHFRRQDPIV